MRQWFVHIRPTEIEGNIEEKLKIIIWCLEVTTLVEWIHSFKNPNLIASMYTIFQT